MSSEAHIPVLLDQVLEVLAPGPGQTLLDCTVGLGGHAEAVASTIGPTGVAILNDADPANLAAAAERIGRLPSPPRVETLRGNFAQAPRRLVELGLAADMVLADLGFASPQMDDPSRGFSFRGDGPLDMRFDPEGPVTAATLVNALSERELGEILRDYGEERLWRQVARKLVAEREASPISTTSRFASIVRSVVGGRNGQSRIDPATRSFQALRIA
ncbi:MAG: 16S rRNA (cytosine(1402)-N(4))-methyltransferase RsmH, partial [Planctomycetota bacterium]|nr:16S rRNA (cytosine(1402)-N(4))-methyltransferase RsmH [Planctomycetota bacterium]